MPPKPANDPKALRPEELQRKRIYELSLLVLSMLTLALLTVVQRHLLNLGPGLSSNQGVITLVSINISMLVLGLLLFLILRGLYRIFFERRDYGSLQTKMVISFISLSLMPTLLIFYFSYLLMGQDHATWFSSGIRDTFEDALALSEYAQELDRRLTAGGLADLRDELAGRLDGGVPPPVGQAHDGPPPADRAHDGRPPGDQAQTDRPPGDQAPPDPAQGGPAPPDAGAWAELLASRRLALNLESAELYDAEGLLVARAGGPGDGWSPVPAEWLLGLPAEVGGPGPGEPWPGPDGRPGRYASPIVSGGRTAGFLAVGSLSREAIENKVGEISAGLAKYRVALDISEPFRVARLTSLTGVTLLAVFLSIWIGSHLAGSLAGPVKELVEGTRRVAKGELDFVLAPANRSAEMAHLVAAFNQMTRELKDSYSELDRRRRFSEAILRHVSSGVLIFDHDDRLTSLNQAATDLLGLEGFEPGGPTPAAAAELLSASRKGQRGTGHAFVEVGDQTLSLTVRRGPLLNEEGRSLGFLITFDDVSELERAQRRAAWREVARRIAHEIKNPLTPISLSAQRLRRRFAERLSAEADAAVFDECTAVIIRQVENMRRLVNEFSQFARLPEISPRPADFVKVAEEALALFRSAHPMLAFSLGVRRPPGVFVFDPEQIGRVVTNLLANSAAATGGRGRVDLSVDLDPLTGVSLTVSDDGPGLSPEMKDRVFEPYVTTGPDGHGLGLAIVSAIVRDHGGYVRVADNLPAGTSFTVTIPYRQL
jgi:two-component system nitrogen regulation sensor histidine kinase NtrY